MNDELNLDIPPEAGLEVTKEIIMENSVPAAAPAEISETVETAAENSGEITDSTGAAFNPAIHKADETGNPLFGSKRQFLLKPEAKKMKNLFNSARDKVTEFFHREKTDAPEIPNNEKVAPLSDHELPPGKKIPPPPVSKDGITASAENSAEMFFLGGSMMLGIEFLNQRKDFHPEVARQISDYERRTGKSIDLPPGLALLFGLGRIGYEIVQREPACKERFDKGAKVVRNNAMKYVTRKLPRFGKKQENPEPAGDVQ